MAPGRHSGSGVTPARGSSLFYARGLPVLAAVLALVWGFWSLPLYDLDEGAFTEATREMMASGNYVSIYLNAEPRHDKPILIYWLQAASAQVFGLNEFALRLPSVLAGLLWCLAVYRFTRRELGRDTAVVAATLMALSLYVGIVSKGAVADALLNLFLALAFFDIYRQFVRPSRAGLLRVFLWLGLGFLTKGPVAVAFPLLGSAALYLPAGRWRDWLKALFDPLGLALFLIIVLPWHIAVYLDTGWAFFEGFYLHHNLDRYGGAMEGHSGGWWYYIVWAPLIVLPFSGWLLRLLPTLRTAWSDPLERYLWAWFFIVLVVFSFSGTKLPHYLLYGCSPLFILMARYREHLRNRWLAYLPPLLLFAALAALPQLFDYLARHTRREYEQTLFALAGHAFGFPYQLAMGTLGLLLLIILLRVRSAWRGLVLTGLLQAMAVAVLVLPRVFDVMQGPVKDAALFAKAHAAEVVRYRAFQPSFSVYREAVVTKREPQPGDWVMLRVDHLEQFRDSHPDLPVTTVYQKGTITLLAVAPGSEANG